MAGRVRTRMWRDFIHCENFFMCQVSAISSEVETMRLLSRAGSKFNETKNLPN